MARLRYKVVETMTVTDEALEELLNHWTGLGWQFDGLRFAMSEASRRPQMAFAIFTRSEPDDGGREDGQGGPDDPT